jgi:ABC-type transport system involved in multi-copper enzyme maturation permease subunit
MLFMGVLISVGPPFSGESSEASALTFSLPWSRGRWLSEKVAMSAGLIALLILPAYAVGYAMTSFDPIPQMYGTMFIEPMHLLDIMPSVVCGIVGIALGISCTMLTRNALIGAVCGALAAYGLSMFNVYSLFPSMRYTGEHMTVLDLGTTTGLYVALTVIVGAIGLSYVRLTRTDF